MTITAAADGSALGNPGPAGWAWYIDADRWAAGGWPHGTNNMGELKAVLELFRATAEVDDDLLVLCDSQYVINSVVKWMPGWKRKGWRKADGSPVMNVELMKDIDAALAGRRYRFEWVKGHVGHELNEAADERARAVATAYQRGGEIPAGPGFRPLTGAAAARAAAAPAPRAHRLVLELSADEWSALERRARDAAVSPEALLRSLAVGSR
ncbi:ribonuclease HI [Amnibacterium kyonggiense]|uniref:Ribonuclease H n=1 Tax=Amnibacterium kyonggiense TaxID=595671 RepID=A0A4R7FKP4_9MICO|nr:ribonuclease HI [Amnibacterium kyonggiense]